MAEAEVALRLAEHLLGRPRAAPKVAVAIDGAVVMVHGKQVFNVKGVLKRHRWTHLAQVGKNPWTGTYRRKGQQLLVHSRSGRGDVVIRIGRKRIVAECKKGPLVKKPGSPERRILTEVLGQALLWPAKRGDVVVVAVPDTGAFRRHAGKFRVRPLLQRTGIRICLVSPAGRVSGLEL